MANEKHLRLLRQDVNAWNRWRKENPDIHPIIRDIWNSIWAARIVVADVSDKNPNVNYGLGVCHTLGVPTILIAKRIEDVPFDYRHHGCITYNTDNAGWEATLIHQLTLALASVLVDGGRTDDLLWPYDTFLLEKPQDVTVAYMAEYI